MSIRFTKNRTAILECLKQSPEALSAAQIHASLPTIDLATIYRNLELFAAEKLIKKIHLEGTEAYFEYQTEPHHHAVCSTCEKVVHFLAPDRQITKLLGLEGFTVDELDITVKGNCNKHKK